MKKPKPTDSSIPVDYFVHPSSYVDEGAVIGRGTKIWHFSHIQAGAVIGENCSIGQNVNIANNVRIGNYVKIQNNISVYEGVELEDYVFCGPSMVFTNIMDPRSEFPQRGSEFYLKTLVKRSASIGANATIVCGNTIGRSAFIGAGSVVTRDILDFALVYGNPAVLRGWVCACGARLVFEENRALCGKCGREYLLQNGLVSAVAGEENDSR
ncbi:MAG: acyltransferase [Candidatus Euphemobacter frigidus]|nr:acyltransferase [Candidatus Euphemobacter frigidus]MDP8274919.1 acyltransferase [Candidatus Euphemobacter frigidus]